MLPACSLLSAPQVFEKTTGSFVQMLANPQATPNQLQSPLCVAVDQLLVYITDATNNRVQIYDKQTGAFVRQV